MASRPPAVVAAASRRRRRRRPVARGCRSRVHGVRGEHASIIRHAPSRRCSCARRSASVQAIYAWCRELDETVDGVEALRAPRRRRTEAQRHRGGPARLVRRRPGRRPRRRALIGAGDHRARGHDPTHAGPRGGAVPGHDRGHALGPRRDPRRQHRPALEDVRRLAGARAYCYAVAGTVGAMTLPVMGTARGYTVEQASTPGIELGIALQLTNILRDVGEDARRGRLYLPLDAIARTV